MEIKAKNLPQLTLRQRAIDALIEKLGISGASEFWYSLGYGGKDYTNLRKKMFNKETVGTLYKKVKQFEKR